MTCRKKSYVKKSYLLSKDPGIPKAKTDVNLLWKSNMKYHPPYWKIRVDLNVLLLCKIKLKFGTIP